MFCSKCGQEVGEGVNFCPKCGNKVGSNSSWEAPFENKAEVSKAKDENISPKSRLVATLLCFFLGGFGAHNFYLGRTGRGISKIVLYFISLILCLVPYLNLLSAFDSEGNPTVSNAEADSVVMDSIGPLIFGIILISVVSIWILIELIMILAGSAKDSNGRLVKNWEN